MMSRWAEGGRASAGELTKLGIATSEDSAATLAEEGDHSLMLPGGLAQPCSLARLTVHAALLARFRILLPDLENLRHARARAQIFQVRHAVSDAGERSVYRKTDLEHSARKLQISAT